VLLSVIEDQKVAEAALMAERNLRQRYLDMVEAVIIALDIRGYITLVNRKGCIVLGYDEEELLGRNWFADCLPQPEGLAEDYQAFQQAIQGTLREVEHYEYEILTRLGERRLIAWHTTVLRDGQGHITGLLCAGDDISEQRQAEWQLSAQLDELRRWQSLTFGRENRVLELKLEVNALLAEQGKPPRYSSAGKMAAEHRQ
jgi:PAS domain S-box-containing protein